MTGIGYNVHMSYTTVGTWNALLNQFAQDKPGALLLLDSFGDMAHRALEAANRLPDTIIVYRKFLQGDHQHTYLSPAQWVAEHAAFKGTRVRCSADNEPNFTASLSWLLDVAKAARENNLRASLGGFSVGGYELSDIPKMDVLLRYLAQYPGWHNLDLHEYTRGLWCVDVTPDATNPANWLKFIAPVTQLWLMGRFREIFKYCDSRGIKRPQIVIGEWGFDRVHAVPTSLYGDVGGLHTNAALWQSWGFSDWEQYAADQLQAAWHAIYRPYPEILGVCYYQLSDHAGNWRDFNAWYAPTFREAARKGFERMTPTKPPSYTPYPVGKYTLIGNGVRVRTGADTDASIVSTALSGDVVEVLSAVVNPADGYGWQNVRHNGKQGDMALHGPVEKVTWSLKPAPVEPVPDVHAQFADAMEVKALGMLELIAEYRQAIKK